MSDLTSALITLFVLVIASAFFSGSETAMMAINRYRIRHLARKNNVFAKRINQLLERPDRLLGMIIIGNTFANIFASAIATYVALILFGDIGVAYAAIVMTFILLIFGEITPKTLAALFPEKIAFIICWPVSILLKLTYPLVWLLNLITNSFLKIFGIEVKKIKFDHLSSEELRTILYESKGYLPRHDQNMMMGVLDLSTSTVSDIKVPKKSIIGIDWEEKWENIIAKIITSDLHRMPVYKENIDNCFGILNVRDALKLYLNNQLSREKLQGLLSEPYFVPESTALQAQLNNFRREKNRIGLIVDEYGEIQGLITLDDILEEIVGEFTTNFNSEYRQIIAQKDGSYLMSGDLQIRDINRQLDWQLPTDGPNTLSGLIIDYLEMLPTADVCVKINGYAIEIVKIEDKRIKLVQVHSPFYQPEKNTVPGDIRE